MRMRSPIQKKHARIEIIPLIDIMFFLLASFMMVSLSQTHMKGIRVTLPSTQALPASDPTKKDFVSLRVQAGNAVYMDNQYIANDDVKPRIMQLVKANPDLKVSISAEMLAAHGDVIRILDEVRDAGVKKIGYQIRAAPPAQ